MSHHVNIVRIKVVANALDTLKEKVVFVGGATISLYPDKPVLEVRPTGLKTRARCKTVSFRRKPLKSMRLS
jgi:hypothetical protein